MSVAESMDKARAERSHLYCMPPESAVSLTFANRGENEPGMEKIGGAASQLVTMDMLKSAKMQWGDEAELYDLSAMVDNELVDKHMGGGAGVLVLRKFAQRLMGEDAPSHIEHELELQKQRGKIDSKALMRGQVKNKNARHNNVMANFDQDPDHAKGKGTVVKLEDYPFINALASHAAMWMQQDNPLICEQNRYYNVESCGIGWHGDAEREIVLGYRAGEATKKMPMMFQAFYQGCLVGPQTRIKLNRGDVYIMTSKAVGTDSKQKTKVTWRHAAGNPDTCSYVKVKHSKLSEQATKLKSAIGKKRK